MHDGYSVRLYTFDNICTFYTHFMHVKQLGSMSSTAVLDGCGMLNSHISDIVGLSVILLHADQYGIQGRIHRRTMSRRVFSLFEGTIHCRMHTEHIAYAPEMYQFLSSGDAQGMFYRGV